ncbi:M13 family metallopeptidase [Nesterenkonia aerolata]|uniref:M13-type metalloendopeptidase n=1 Tax=Nesterenkonia aerolata TaxID=3074079 RepID=A0ABU2DU90_9MICC|nr:M13-type metalloendopeptidase [Nesterenkonia sp. LY-0111]MDR8020077.1 M13-type metalloendopeptidase [Nesterenkonia sp. LY-0111]
MSEQHQPTAQNPRTFPYIDASVRPQDDLQRHVNGQWLSTAEIPADLDSYGAFIELRDKSEADVRVILEEAAQARTEGTADEVQARIGGFYTAFMDAERAEQLGLEPLREMLAEIDAVDGPAELVRLSASWQRIGVDSVVAAGAMRDAGNPQRMLWHIFQDGLGLPDESYYRDGTHAETLEAYRHHLARLLGLGGVSEPRRAADAVVELEKKLATYHWDVVTLRDAQKRYNLMSVHEVLDSAPLLSEAIRGWGLSDTQAEEIVVGQPDYLPALQRLLTGERLEDWQHWLRVQVLRAYAPLLHSAVVQEHFDFYSRTLSGAEQLKARWKRGVALTNAHLGEDVAQPYVARHYPPQAEAAMGELIDALLEAYRSSISGLEWMGEQTRQKALEKLDTFRPMVGYPAKWIDYSDVEVDPADLVGNVRRAVEAAWARDVRKLDDGPDPEEWHMTPQTVNAYYHPLENVICFPAAILQPPFFDAARDMAANFGGIGAVIGHEIGHGFDDQGSRFGADGSLTDWWTAQDRQAFEERTAVLVDQYNQLSPAAAPQRTVNGELTLGENIGDLGGLGIAHQAYRLWQQNRAQAGEGDAVEVVDGLTPDQRYFFSWAQVWRFLVRPERAVTLLSVDPHSPAEIRANQVVKNLDAFHEAFGTEEGDGMWLAPAQRVTIW